MRTAYSCLLAHHLFKSLLFFLVLFLPGIVFGQLTHVETEVSIDSNLVMLDDSTEVYEKRLVAMITPNDLDDFGKISVVVYQAPGHVVVCDEIVRTKEELISELINGSSFILGLCPYIEGQAYEVVFSPETVSGAFVEINQVHYPY